MALPKQEDLKTTSEINCFLYKSPILRYCYSNNGKWTETVTMTSPGPCILQPRAMHTSPGLASQHLPPPSHTELSSKGLKGQGSPTNLHTGCFISSKSNPTRLKALSVLLSTFGGLKKLMKFDPSSKADCFLYNTHLLQCLCRAQAKLHPK
jgi:hypothetical protein